MIYLIAGRARSGKNTLATFIQEELEKRGRKVCNIGLMRTLKGYCKDYFGWDGRDETKPRELLQEFGTGIIREKMNKPLFHIVRLTEDIDILSNFFDDFIVDDVRFPIEVEEIKKRFNDTYAIYITRSNYVHDEMTEKQRHHVTETSLDNFNNYDIHIENKTLEQLKNSAELIVREVESNEENDK